MADLTSTAKPNDTARSTSREKDIPLELITILLIAMIVVSFVGNSLVCIAIYIQPRLQKLTYYPVLSLAIADLSCALIAMPAYTMKKYSFDKATEKTVCDLFRFSYFFTEYASVLSLTVISLERFYVIRYPLKWHGETLSMYFIILLFGVWAEVALVSSMPFYWQNDGDDNCNYRPTPAWSIMVISIQVVCPFIFITLCYAFIYSVVRRHEKSISANTPASSKTHTSADFAQTWKTERKSTGTLALVLGVFVVCWGPSTFYYFLQIVCHQCFSSQFHREGESLIKAVVKLLTFFNSCVNPVIYCWRNKEFRTAFARVICRMRRRRLSVQPDRDRRNALAPSTINLNK